MRDLVAMDDENGLFSIEISEDESNKEAKEKTVPRDFQSEEDFERQRSEWKPKRENGEVVQPRS